jgi:hypothetical protein
MDRAPSAPTAQEIASLVVERLIQEGGLEDLANASLMTIEDRTSIPQQQHGQSDDAPANSWEGRVAVIQCDAGIDAEAN